MGKRKACCVVYFLALIGQCLSQSFCPKEFEGLSENDLMQKLLEKVLQNKDVPQEQNTAKDLQRLWRSSLSGQNILTQMVKDDLHTFDGEVTATVRNQSKIVVDVLPPCASAILITLLAASDWSIRMIDASGLPGTTGVFEGNLHAIGSYEECVKINVKDQTICEIKIPEFRGRYALATVTLVASESENGTEKSLSVGTRHDDYGSLNGHTLAEDFLLGLIFGMPRLGLCVPSVCTAEMVERSLNKVLENFATVAKLPLGASIGNYNYVEEDNKDFTGGDIAALTILTLILLMAVLGTAIDVTCGSKRRDVASRILICFSVYSNGKKLLSTKKSEDSITCVNGIRLLSMTWVVLGHTWYVASFMPWNNPLSVSDIYNDPGIMLVFGATLAVDTFFFLAGFLMAFLMLKDLDKNKGRTQILFGYLHRYIRLTPAYGLIMLMFSTLIVHLGSGPFWYFLVKQSQNCATNWWANLLYINNYIDTTNMCMGESWYMACDFQLFIIGPLMVWPMWKFPKIGVPTVFALLVSSTVIPGALTAVNDWPAQKTATRLSDSWFGEFYIATYTRASPYIYGILFGYFMYSFSQYHRVTGKKINKFIIAGGWLLSAAFCLTTVLGLQNYWALDLKCSDESNPCYNELADASYAALGRLTWSLGVSWVVFACATGYGGIVDKFLSWSFLAPLSRLTFCTYLIHLHMMFIFHFGRGDVMEFGQYLMVYFFVGHIIMTMVLAVFCTLLFESPFIGLEKIAMGGGGRKRPERTQENPSSQKTEEAGTTKKSNSGENGGIANPAYEANNQDA